MSEFASPFALLVIADLLGVPESDHDMFRSELAARDPAGAVGSTADAMTHSPLEFLYERFTVYVEDRRRDPTDDVLTGLATATFPDGSSARGHRRRARGREPLRRRPGDDGAPPGERVPACSANTPSSRTLLRADRDRIPNFVEEMLRFESPVKATSAFARVATKVGGVDIPAGTTVMVLNGAANRDPRRFEAPAEFQVDRRERPATHRLRARHRTPVRARRWLRAEASVSIERILDRIARPRDLGDGARPARCTPVRLRADLHPARAQAAVPGVHAGRLSAVARLPRAPEEAVDVRGGGRGCRTTGLGRHREVDGCEHRALEVQVEHAASSPPPPGGECRDLVRGGERGGAALRRRGTRGWRGRSRAAGAAEIRSPVNAPPSEQQARVQRPRERAAVGGDEAHRHVRVGEVRRLRHADDVARRDPRCSRDRRPDRSLPRPPERGQ